MLATARTPLARSLGGFTPGRTYRMYVGGVAGSGESVGGIGILCCVIDRMHCECECFVLYL